MKKHESSSDNDNSFLKTLIQKFNQQQDEKQKLEKQEQAEAEQARLKNSTESANKTKPDHANKPPKTNTIKLNEPIDNLHQINRHKLDLNSTPKLQPITLTPTSPTPLKIPTAQSLNILTAQQVKPTLAVPVPVLQSNIVTLNGNHHHHQFGQNGTPTTSTIVKLNPTQINFNNLGSIKKNTLVIPSPTSLSNNNAQTNNQQFKHIVVPKSSPKLIILPSNNNPSNKLNGIHQSVVLNDSQNAVQKICLLKSNSIPNDLGNMSTPNTELIRLEEHQSGNDNLSQIQLGKNFKLTNSSGNSIKLNVSQPNLKSKANIQIVSKQNSNNNNSENFRIINKIKLDQMESESQIAAPLSSSSSTSSVTSSPPNWSETNLELIKDILNELNGKPKEVECNSNSNIKVLYETVKEKLEKNVYGCVEDFYTDLKLIKDNDLKTIKLND